MKKALVRANLALLVVLTSPVIALAADGDGETMLDWFFRMLRWAAGGWHGF